LTLTPQKTNSTITNLPDGKPHSEDECYQAKERYRHALNALIDIIAHGDDESINRLLEFLRKQDTTHEAVQDVLQLKFLQK
jgi:formate dehydrogenase maturation protein FdhE